MKLKILISFFLFIQHINTVTIYQCSKYLLTTNQCLNKWVDEFGIIHADLSDCGVNQYCQELTEKEVIEGNSIGVCIKNYKYLYSGDKCNKHFDCASHRCENNICFGFKYGALCEPKKYQCDNNLVCKKSIEKSAFDNNKTVYRCSNLSKINETCENDDECDVNLICGKKLNLNGLRNICSLSNCSHENYLNLRNQYYKNNICIERNSLENGVISSNEMACKSGILGKYEISSGEYETFCVSKLQIIENCVNLKCKIKANFGIFGDRTIEENCIFTTKGNLLCPLNEKEKAWQNYINEYKKTFVKENNNIKNSRTHIPKYKSTFDIFGLAELYFKYKEWENLLEADECTYNYFFGNNNSKTVHFNILMIIYIIFNIF